MAKTLDDQDDLEYRYGYTEVDLKEYGAKIEQETERSKRKNDLYVSADVKADVENMDKSMEMESLNLFGLPERTDTKTGHKLQDTVRQLIH